MVPSSRAKEIENAVSSSGRLAVLDGWRGLSILFVMAAHMLPLGPKSWELNVAAGSIGMSLFFTLSGFLITSTLQRNAEPVAFFIRRFMRIIPLAFLYLLIVLPFLDLGLRDWLAHFTFSVNYLSSSFHHLTLHFWSLCVEIHFYILIGMLAAVGGKRSLTLLPLALAATTVAIIVLDEHGTMKTHFRVDQILAGGVLALIHTSDKAAVVRRFLARLPLPFILVGLVLSSLAIFWRLDWMRAYFGMALIGHSLYRRSDGRLGFLENRFLVYVAEISFALYIIHPLTMAGALGSGTGVEKYMKRPLSFALSFGLAHLSTRYFENRFINLGKAWISRRKQSKGHAQALTLKTKAA
jgi:peptidoglycan/LPS O-acetylase OafA/YrhL